MTDKELLQEALNQLEHYETKPEFNSNINKTIAALRARLSQPEQEPVAWMWNVHSGAGYTSRGIDFYPTSIPFAKHTPLYTAPPQREWQRMTDEEIVVRANAEVFAEAFARGVAWAEQKLKEKNT